VIDSSCHDGIQGRVRCIVLYGVQPCAALARNRLYDLNLLSPFSEE